MTIEFDDPIFNEREDEETNLKLLDAQDQKQEYVGIIENQLKESWNPADNCKADSENLMDIMDSQSHGKEMY